MHKTRYRSLRPTAAYLAVLAVAHGAFLAPVAHGRLDHLSAYGGANGRKGLPVPWPDGATAGYKQRVIALGRAYTARKKLIVGLPSVDTFDLGEVAKLLPPGADRRALTAFDPRYATALARWLADHPQSAALLLAPATADAQTLDHLALAALGAEQRANTLARLHYLNWSPSADKSPFDLALDHIEQVKTRLTQVRRALSNGEELPAYISSAVSHAALFELERALGIPALANASELAELRFKDIARQLMQRAGVDVVPGGEHRLAKSVQELAEMIAEILRHNPEVNRLMVQLRDSFSSEGNAEFNARGLDRSDLNRLAALVVERLAGPKTEFVAETFETFGAKLKSMGAVVTQFVEQHIDLSAGIFLAPGDEDYAGYVELLGTTEQIQSSGRVCHQWRPMAQHYAEHLPAAHEAALKIGAQIITEAAEANLAFGGWAGIDFLLDPVAGVLYSGEINLRRSATTGPHQLALLHAGENARYDLESGWHVDAQGRPVAWWYSDYIGGGLHGKATNIAVTLVRRMANDKRARQLLERALAAGRVAAIQMFMPGRAPGGRIGSTLLGSGADAAAAVQAVDATREELLELVSDLGWPDLLRWLPRFARSLVTANPALANATPR